MRDPKPPLVRVLQVVAKPGDVAKMHHHPDRVIHVVKGGKMRLTIGGKTQDNEIKAGSVTFNEAQDHEAKNIGNATIDFILMEVKN